MVGNVTRNTNKSNSMNAIPIDPLRQSRKLSTNEAAQVFERLEPVSIDFMIGKWRGEELFTGSPMDGFLEATGWAGKEFADAETVFPLVFFTDTTQTETFYVDPAAVSKPDFVSKYQGGHLGERRAEVETHAPTARLRMIDYKGVVSAAMIYDQIPTIDRFRQINDSCVMGVMNARGQTAPYYFRLNRL